MQFTIDSAKRNYFLRTNLMQNQKEGKSSDPAIVDRGITTLDKSAAFLAGAAISSIVSNLKQTNSKLFLKTLEKIPVLPSFEETQQISDRIIEKMKSKNQHLKVIYVKDNTSDAEQLSQIILKDYLGGFKKIIDIDEKSFLAKSIKFFFADRKAKKITTNQESAFLINEKIAITNENTYQMMFHEIGHAKVANSKILRPLLTVGKKLPIVSFIAGFFALEHTPLPNDPKNPKSFLEKMQDYTDDNIGKITFLTFIPLSIEKIIASRKSLNLVRNHLDKSKIKSLRKLYVIGSLAYLATAFAASAGIGLGNKIQNNIIKQKQSPQDVFNLLI